MQKILVIAAFLAASLLTMAASAAEQAAKPTDPQIAHIVYTANLLDIEAAKQALQKSKNDGVRTFAQQMVGDHTTVNNQALALVKKLNVKPEDNPTSQSLKKEADATRNKLASLNGAAFERLTSTMRWLITRRSTTRSATRSFRARRTPSSKRCCRAA
jgi:putative membrane protein